MIIDTVENFSKYTSLNPLFSEVEKFLDTYKTSPWEVKKQDLIPNELKVITSESKGKTIEESLQKFECHNQFIDVQVCVSGTETFGWRNRASCTHPKGEYNEEKDVLFFGDDPQFFYQLKPGQFSIFFPEDVHAPMIGEDVIKKIVFKVKI